MSVERYLQNPNLARFPFVFIITFGRSGSTLLQGILNSINGYEIKGENFATLFALFMASRQHEHARLSVQSKTDPRNPWFGADTLNPEAFSQSLADVFLRSCLQPQEGMRCVGFKEIRHLPAEIPDALFPEYLDFLQTNFPGAALVFNVRNTSAAVDSGWWAALDPEETQRKLDAAVERFKSYAAGRPNCFIFSYDALMADPAYGKTLFDFLGESFDLDSLEELLTHRHSTSGPRRVNLLETIEAKSAEIRNMEAEIRTMEVETRTMEEEFFRTRRRVDRLESLISTVRDSASWNARSPLGRIRLIGRKLFRRN